MAPKDVFTYHELNSITKNNLRSSLRKRFGLLQLYFGRLSCMPVVYDTLQTSREATDLILNQSVVEKLLPLLNLVSPFRRRITFLVSLVFL